MSEKEKNTQNNIEEAFNQNQNRIICNSSNDINKITEWIHNLSDSEKRVYALVELSKKRDYFSDLAIYLWYSPGVISVLYVYLFVFLLFIGIINRIL